MRKWTQLLHNILWYSSFMIRRWSNHHDLARAEGQAGHPLLRLPADCKDVGHAGCSVRAAAHTGISWASTRTRNHREAITLWKLMPHNLFQQQDVIPAPPAGISAGEKALKVRWERYCSGRWGGWWGEAGYRFEKRGRWWVLGLHRNTIK